MIRSLPFFSLALLTALLPPGSQAAPTLQLVPANGAVFGSAGSTIGWGFTLTNPDNNYMVITGSAFNWQCQACPPPPSSLGTYTDFIGNPSNFFVLGPAPEENMLSQAFNRNAGTGVGSFTIASSAVLNGFIQVDYALYATDPNSPSFDPARDLITPDAQLYAPVSVNAPEPATILLMLVSGGILAGAVKAKRQ